MIRNNNNNQRSRNLRERLLQRQISLEVEQRGALSEPLLDDENIDITSFIFRYPQLQEPEVLESLQERSKVVFNQSFYPIIGMLCQTF